MPGQTFWITCSRQGARAPSCESTNLQEIDLEKQLCDLSRQTSFSTGFLGHETIIVQSTKRSILSTLNLAIIFYKLKNQG